MTIKGVGSSLGNNSGSSSYITNYSAPESGTLATTGNYMRSSKPITSIIEFGLYYNNITIDPIFLPPIYSNVNGNYRIKALIHELNFKFGVKANLPGSSLNFNYLELNTNIVNGKCNINSFKFVVNDTDISTHSPIYIINENSVTETNVNIYITEISKI